MINPLMSPKTPSHVADILVEDRSDPIYRSLPLDLLGRACVNLCILVYLTLDIRVRSLFGLVSACVSRKFLVDCLVAIIRVVCWGGLLRNLRTLNLWSSGSQDTIGKGC
jgi:hypothetical protein